MSAQANEPTGHILNDFILGVQKAVRINLFTMIPNFIMAFTCIRVLELTGVLDLLGKLMTPIMSIFGLPGVAAVPWVSSWLSSSGGIGATAALIEAGQMQGSDAPIILPMMLAMGGIQLFGRILAVTGVPTKYYLHIALIGILNSIFVGIVMNLLSGFFK